MNLSRIQRLLRLLALLQAGRGYNVESLAEACGVSRRTIFRDLDVLRESGLPLIYDEPQQRYRSAGHVVPAADQLHAGRGPRR